MSEKVKETAAERVDRDVAAREEERIARQREAIAEISGEAHEEAASSKKNKE